MQHQKHHVSLLFTTSKLPTPKLPSALIPIIHRPHRIILCYHRVEGYTLVKPLYLGTNFIQGVSCGFCVYSIFMYSTCILQPPLEEEPVCRSSPTAVEGTFVGNVSQGMVVKSLPLSLTTFPANSISEVCEYDDRFCLCSLDHQGNWE